MKRFGIGQFLLLVLVSALAAARGVRGEVRRTPNILPYNRRCSPTQSPRVRKRGIIDKGTVVRD